MLTAESYHTAWIFYGVATLAALAILYVWIGARMGLWSKLFLLVALAGPALIPAHPAADVNTWAPALFVFAFTLLTNELELANAALRSMAIGEAMLLGLCLVAWLASRVLSKSR